MDQENREWSRISKDLVQDPGNYELWQKLVAAAEHDNGKGITKSSTFTALACLRLSYEDFLKQYPLLFKYWSAYALWEFKLGQVERADEIFRKGLRHLSFLIEFWMCFLRYQIETCTNNINETLDLFEEARSKIGYHFHSFEFYSLYLDFLKGYLNETNDFEKRYFILLRMIVEIPTYHYSHFFNLLFESIAQIGQNLRPDTINFLIPPAELETLKKSSPKQIATHLKKVFTDTYIATQYKVYELFSYEKCLARNYYHFSYISQQQLGAWESYIDFLELRQFPRAHIESVYERCLIVTSDYPKFWQKYTNYHVNKQDYCAAVETLSRGFAQCGDYELVVRLADTYIALREPMNARDIIVAYIANNVLTPFPVYEKLVNIEHFMHPQDHDYLLDFVSCLISKTQQAMWFQHILLLPIADASKHELFKQHSQAFSHSPVYQDALCKFRERTSIEPILEESVAEHAFDKEYDKKMATILQEM